MTREEFETQLRADNPSTTIDGQTYTAGDPEYEAQITAWADAWEAAYTDPKATAQRELDAGYLLEPEGWTIGCTREDIENFNLLRAHVNNKIETGQILVLTGTVNFKDRGGTWRTLSVTRFRQMVSEVGDYHLARWAILTGD